MTAIATSGFSARDDLAALLRSSTPASGAPQPAAAEKPDAATAKGDGPAVVVDLSDRAKALLERNKADQLVADQLAQRLASAKDDGKSGSTSKSTADDTTKLFDSLSGQGTPEGIKDLGDYMASRMEAHRQPDGTIASFTETVTDSFQVPSTAQEIDEWYRSEGQAIIIGAQQIPEEAATGIDEAVRNRSVTIQNAKDIPGLNFHNTVTFQGGEGGGSGNGTFSYDHDAAIFKDPTTSYRVYSNGTVISWKPPAA